MRVQPLQPCSSTQRCVKESTPHERPLDLKPQHWTRWRHRLMSYYNWLLWLFVAALVLCQVACVVWDTTSTTIYVKYGEDPTRGVFKMDGLNDDPFTDRGLICMRRGRVYRPVQLQEALDSPRTERVDLNGSDFVGGYRFLSRRGLELSFQTLARYTVMCDALAATLPGILTACNSLGFSVSDGDLFVVDGLESQSVKRIREALPVVIMPYWDNAIYARTIIPGVDGMACVAKLTGQYDTREESKALLEASPRRTLVRKTAEWLNIPNGTWRNGWLEDEASAERWYSCTASTHEQDPYGVASVVIDLISGTQLNCRGADVLACSTPPLEQWWGNQFMCTTQQLWGTSVTISNGKRDGIFLYEAKQRRQVRTVYKIASLISNSSVLLLLARWLIVLVALQPRHNRANTTDSTTAGIGCLSHARSFEFLPILLLPRLRIILAAFFTVGGYFEGEQLPFSEAWYAIYPAIAEFTILHFSMLNLLAKALQRRMTDVGFGPTLCFFCLLHYLRRDIALQGWFGIDGRIATVVSAKRFSETRLIDFVRTRIALQLNGDIVPLFLTKMAVLVLNFIPLFFTNRPTTLVTQAPVCAVERALAVLASLSGGLGQSCIYISDPRSNGKEVPSHDDRDCGVLGENKHTHSLLQGYELVRFGYIVIGDTLVMHIDSWYWLLALALLRAIKLDMRVSIRVLAFPMEPAQAHAGISTAETACLRMSPRSKLYRVDDALQLTNARVWTISAPPLP